LIDSGSIDWEDIEHALALGQQGAMQRARHGDPLITDLAKAGQFNAVEIANVRVKSFLGLHYATVRGHARHIQQSPILSAISAPAQDASTRKLENA
jgi:hypothetical protein